MKKKVFHDFFRIIWITFICLLLLPSGIPSANSYVYMYTLLLALLYYFFHLLLELPTTDSKERRFKALSRTNGMSKLLSKHTLCSKWLWFLGNAEELEMRDRWMSNWIKKEKLFYENGSGFMDFDEWWIRTMMYHNHFADDEKPVQQ